VFNQQEEAMPDVITRVIVNDRQSIRADIPLIGGETKEYKFSTDFRTDREVVAGEKTIVVFVRFDDTQSGTFPVEVTLTKPGETAPFLTQVQNNRPDPSLPDLPLPSGADPVLGVLFGPDTGGFPDLSHPVGPVTGDPTPPDVPAIPDRLVHTIAATDPNGQWRVTIRNIGSQTAIYRILIAHPGVQVPLSQSAIPLTLVNRMLEKIRKLMGLKLTFGRQARFDYSEEFKRLTDAQPAAIDVNKVTDLELLKLGPEPFPGNDVFLRDIRLDALSLRLREEDSRLVFNAHLGFETAGAKEIAINTAPDIDLTRLAIDIKGALGNRSGARLVVPNPSLVLTDQCDFLGKVTARFTGQVSLEVEIAADVRASVASDKIRGSVASAVRKALMKSDTRRTLVSLADHFTDHLMFLATADPERVFFDIGARNGQAVVTHYARPSVKVLIQEGGIVEDQPVAPTPPRGRGDGPSGIPGLVARTGSPGTSEAAPTTSAEGSPATGATRSTVTPASAVTRRVDHIVVLMMENRSFDHMLGYLSLEKSRDDVDGLQASHSNPVPGSVDHQRVHRLGSTIVLTDPSHSHPATLEQIAGGAMSGFVANYQKKTGPGEEGLVMGFYTDFDLTVFDFLADKYTLCDRWFCAHPGPTYPNRFISLMGSTPSLNNIELGGEQAGGMKGDTIFDVLTRAKVSWKYVESNVAFLRMFDTFRVDETNIIQRSRPLGSEGLISGKTFLELAESGRLPAVTWIDPNFGELELDGDANDDHPPADVLKGQELICQIYRALTKVPERWLRTLWIITYDEHGGFFDHVPPHGILPDAIPEVPPIHDEGPAFYGVRVPAFLVSPLVGARSVSHTVLDHTSILKTILLNFLGPEAAQTGVLGKRVDSVNDLLGDLNDQPRTDIPSCPEPKPASMAASIPREPVDPESFHLGMRMFPFGFKLKRRRPVS
jgi:phospholipase C